MTIKRHIDIDGGCKVRRNKRQIKWPLITAWLAIGLILNASSAFAQGSIFGTVTNSDAGVPANGDISFFGYLDNTDEEIRIETSTGAGYDAGNWFDDFQNYLTEAPGNPYDYHFYNIANGEGFVLSKAIPNNSFQQENIVLGTVVWPAAPTGLSGTAISGSAVLITWNGIPGLTYHVYRKIASSGGSFFRLDNPAGSLANPGVADSFFVDVTADGATTYHYLIIAQNVSNDLGPHSAILTVNASDIQSPVLASISPTTGVNTGGTLVNVYGSGFDPAGTSVSFGGTLAAGTYLSPYHLTVNTPAGALGATDVTVINTASGLSSNTLTGAFTYYSNAAPVVADIPDQTIAEGGTFATINLDDFVSDIDNADSEMSWSYSGNTDLTVNISASRVATITIPNVNWNGAETITFTATDPGSLSGSDAATFTVTAVNDAPVVADIPDQTVAEGGTFATINLDNYVSDVDNLPTEMTWTYSGNTDLTVSIASRVATVTIPDVNWNGTETITFTATDPGLLFGSDAATFTVTAVNDAPVVADIPDQTIIEGETFATINLDDFVSDIDNTDDEIAWTFSGNADLVVSINASRVATISIPNPDWYGVETITFTATDPGLLSDSDDATFTVTAVNDAPVVADIPNQTIAEGASFATINLDDYVTDVDNDDSEITWIYSGNIQLTVNISASRVATITTPSSGWNGSETITFTATDPGLLSDSDDAVFTVSGENDAPILDPIGPKTVAENDNLNFIVTASDPEGVIPTLSATGLPANATFNDNLNGTGIFDFNPNFDQAGIYQVVFKAFDGILVDSEVVAITVINTNRPPVLATIGTRNTTEGVQLTFTVSASDADGTIPVLTTSTLPGSALFADNGDGTGLFDWTPDFTQAGDYTVTFYANDGTDEVFEEVLISVAESGNQPPTVDPVEPQTVAEGNPLTILITASDPDGTIPVLTADSLPDNATFTDNLDGTGTIDFTPDFSQSGTYRVLVMADDGEFVDTMIIVIVVNELGNQPPVITGVADVTIDEGDSLVVVVTATDPEGGSVFFTLSTNIISYNFVDSGNGVAVFRTSASYFDAGVKTLTFFAIDNGTPIATGSATMTITINDVNQPPKFVDLGTVGVRIGRTLNLTIVASDSTDPISSHRLFLTAVGLPANSTFLDNGDNTATFTFTPEASQVGQFIVTFIATDQGTPQLSTNYPLTISVVLQNRKPVFVSLPQSGEVLEGEPLSFTVTATDPDGTIPVLSATGPGTTGLPDNASFVDNLDGTGLFTFNPSYVQSGLYGIYFQAYDGIDMEKSDPVLIQVYEAGNQAPQVQPASPPAITEGETLVYDVSAIDPDGTIPTLRAEAVPENATFTDNGNGTGTINFAPLYYQSGLYDIIIIASDGEFEDTLVVTLTVLEAGNQDPSLAEIADVTVNEGQTINFTITATDPDNDILEFTSSALPGSATLTDNGDNTATFNWVTGYFDDGIYDITVTVTDPASGTDSRSFTITVNNMNRMPYGMPSIYTRTIYEQDTLVIRVTGTDPDLTIPIIRFDSTNYTLRPSMTFVDSGNGVATLTFIPTYTEGGPTPGTQYFVRFLIIDSEDPDSIFYTNPNTQIFVLNRNMPPQIEPIADVTVTEGQSISFGIIVHDVDKAIPITTSPLPEGANFLDWGNNFGVFGWTPNYLQSGVYPIEIYATDQYGPGVNDIVIDTAAFTITVLEAGNQAPRLTSSLADTSIAIVNRTDTTHLIFVDPELESITITASFVPLNAHFVDSGNGAASYLYSPNFSDLGQIFDVSFTATDASGAATVVKTTFKVLEFVRGDANSDNDLDMADAMFLFNFLYREGQPPALMDAADANRDTDVNLIDALYLLNYFFRQGPPPPSD
jgi:hypothetical protein